MNDFLNLIILLLGSATCFLSVGVGLSFWKRQKNFQKAARRLTGALKWQLFGEAVIGAGTLIFAVAAYTGDLSHWTQEQNSALRSVMFIATSVTTIHLWHVVRRLQDA